VAVEVFAGNTTDPMTLAPQIAKLKQRFGLEHVVLVGDPGSPKSPPDFSGCPDRGLITEARVTEDIKSAGLDWITALRAPAIKDLLTSGLIQLCPVYHWLEGRVRAHVFLGMLAYYLAWHMRQRLAPMLFDEADPEAAETRRESVVRPAQPSLATVKKQTTGLTPDGQPVHSFRSLLADLATVARNTIVTAITPLYPITVVTRPTPLQQKAFELLGAAV
jgi:hypothetical protein